MRTALVLALEFLAVCAGCTYGIPAVDPNPGDEGGSAEASSDVSGGDEGGAEAGDSSGGPQEGGNGDAACTGGGVLCTCTSASECSTGICALAVDVGTDLGHTNFCTKPCCTSKDCSSDSVCFASGQGGNYCVDPAWLGRSTPGNAIGGAPCTSGTGCRSGLGLNTGVCADTCCSFGATGGQCASPSQCSFGYFQNGNPDNHFAARCGPPGGANQAGSPCAESSQCAGGLCYTNPPTTTFYCVQPCSTSGECGTGYACQLDVQGTDVYAGCFSWTAGNAQGASCDNFQQCLGGLCSGGKCTNVCFTDGACTFSGWSCKPQQDDSFPPGNYTVLACGP